MSDYIAEPRTMLLPVTLTDADKLLIQGDLSRAITAQEESEAEKREVNKGFNETIKAHKATVHRLNEALILGYAERDVPIEERHGLGVSVEIWRLDTNEMVKVRKLDDEERQLTMLEGGGRAPTDYTTEEQEAASPEEAEAMRSTRLEREHTESRDLAIADAKSRVSCTSYAQGGYRAVLDIGGVEEFELGETADAACAAIVERFVATLPVFEVPPAPTWEQIKAERAEEQRVEEIAALAGEQASDDTATKKRLLRVPTRGPKPKVAKKSGLRVQDESGKELPLPEGDADMGAPAADGQALCEPECETAHEHTAERTAF